MIGKTLSLTKVGTIASVRALAVIVFLYALAACSSQYAEDSGTRHEVFAQTVSKGAAQNHPCGQNVREKLFELGIDAQINFENFHCRYRRRHYSFSRLIAQL